jgi:hypothetical protein
MPRNSEHEGGLATASLQTLLPLAGLTLSRDEQAYLAWARKQDEKQASGVDVAALREVGLSEGEITFVQAMADAKQKYFTPAGCGLNDTSRYLLWDLQHLPKTDQATGRITVQSFLDSVGVSYTKELKKPEDYFLTIRYTMRHAQDGRYPESALLKIFRNVLAWCLEFEKKNGLKERHLLSVNVNDESNGEKAQSQIIQIMPLKPVPAREDEPRMTDKQRGYLLFLMSTMRNDVLREDLRKRLELLSRGKAAKIISELVSGNEEAVSQFF